MSRAKRKQEHILFALETGQKRNNGFDDVQFVHQSLPNIALDNIDVSTELGELKLSSPIFINGMTGGGGEETTKINKSLAIAANECNVAMGVGSGMSALKDPAEKESFQIIRKVNPNGIVFANIGSEATVQDAQRVVEMIEANGLQIHLNVIQELIMPEGDRDFTSALHRIEKIVHGLEVPVLVKEVGFGISKETAQQLFDIGVKIIDVGGYGGTNFSKIENKRRIDTLSYFDNWGIPTAASICEVRASQSELSIVASGGIQNALDVAKAIALGGNVTAFAGYFLSILTNHGLHGLIDEITKLKEHLKIIMTALGTRTIPELQHSPLVIKGDTYQWLCQRGINISQYSKR
ncbi:type 2 isopentenyl-diphosphate Delta-isomerase [Bacillus sp. SM2101]|uniref:type 2 isopentenyl-diphosphate Delta-isomerase n=1 Tax=Bacillus sp. SM2101 TaxID=2805366 RepID=UPI001BDF4CB1|nr:type 2 isopentenyl-diphosphate Delta-isomerase [Bacillus sp. SM2101]